MAKHLVLGYKDTDKSELGAQVYIGKCADAAEKAVAENKGGFLRFEFFRLDQPVRRKNAAPAPKADEADRPEGESAAPAPKAKKAK